MSLTLLAPPAAEPLTLGALKQFLRVEGSDEDGLIGDIARAARRHLEEATGRLFVTQGWRIRRDAWPATSLLALPFGPIQSLDAVTVTGTSGEIVADPALFHLDGEAAPPRLAWTAGVPQPAVPVAGIAIDVTAGYGDPADVPEPLRQALRLLVANWFENRAILAIGHEVAVLPRSVGALIAPYATRRL